MAKTKQSTAAKQPVKPAPKGSKTAKKPVKKERGALLSVLLGLILLHAVFATWIGYSALKDEYRDSLPWVITLLSLISIADIVAAIGMWYWKSWGIQLYAVTRVVAAGIDLMLTGSLLVVFYDILPVSILAYVINLQSKRHLFE